MRKHALFLSFLALTLGGCAMSDHGWQLTSRMRGADGAPTAKNPIYLDTAPVVTESGAKAVSLSNEKTGGSGMLERAIPLQPWQGQRLRVSLRLEDQGAARGYVLAQLNRRDGDATSANPQMNREGAGEVNQFVLEVPQDATDLFLYAGFSGRGAIWVGEPKLETVGHDVALSSVNPITRQGATTNNYGDSGQYYPNGGYNPPSASLTVTPPGPPR